MAALSLNAVRVVALIMRVNSPNPPRIGAIHHCCSPPWITSPARKNPTSIGGRTLKSR
jgi:hypothetical protein